MRQYTKHGLMLLNKMYRSVLMKCALANAIIFLGAIGAANAIEPTNGDNSSVLFDDEASEKISYYDTTTKTIKKVGVKANDEVLGKYGLTDGSVVNILGKQYGVTAASGVISNPEVNEDGSLQGVTDASDYSKSMLFSGKNIAAGNTGIIFGTDGLSGSYGDFSVDFIGNNKNYSGASVANSLVYIGNLATDNSVNHSLTAKFLGNTILASDTSNISGAMIYDDTSHTMTIKGDFVSNNIEASGDIFGGMLYTTAGEDKTITGDFIANSVKSSNNTIYGGLIRRQGSTNPQALNINGVYANNTVEGKDIAGGLINDLAPSEIAIKDSVFSGNKIISSTDSSSKGGLISKKAGKMNITDSQFVNNNFSGKLNGGVLVLEGSDSTVTIKNSQFVNNKGAYSGGVLSSSNSTIDEINVEDSLFEGNEATDGNGGAFDVKANKITLTNADFVGNKASLNGGAIYSSNEDAEINITGGSFKNNKANNGSAIYLASAAKLTVDGTTFEGNKGESYGAVADKGYNIKDVVIKNTTFKDNTAEMGSAIYRNGWDKQGTIAIENTKFIGNNSNDSAVYLENLAEANLTDLTFDGNKSTKSSDLYVGEVGKLAITAQNEDFTVKNSTYGDNANAVSLDADEIVMNAKTGKKIDIQGRAFVGGSGALNIGTLGETGNDGEVVFEELNNNINTLKLAMNEGTLKLGAKTFLDSANRRLSIASLSLNGGAIDLRNGKAGDMLLTKELKGNGTTQLSVDYDPTISGIYDMDGIMLASDATVSGTPVLQLSAINVLADAPETESAFESKARYLWSQNNDDQMDDEHNGTAIAGVVTNALGTVINASTGSYNYVFTETSKGLLSVARTTGYSLPEMINLTGMAADKTNTSYSLTDDLKAGVDLGLLANETGSGTRDATIFLNGHTLNGLNASNAKLVGITTQNGQKLTIDGSRGTNSAMSGFTTALTNADGAELLVKDTSFAGNDVDIQNDGTLTLEGTGSFNNGIVGAGHTILNADTTEVSAGTGTGFFMESIEQDKLTVNDGKTLIANADNLKTNTIENKGTIKLAGGTLDSAITGGDINIEGSVAINKDVAGAINVNSGTLTANAADYIKGNVVNNDVVSLKDGTLSNSITGGQIKIDGNVKANAALAGDILVSTGNKLTAAADNIKKDVSNDGEVDLTGGKLAQKIINGDLTVSGDVTTDADNLMANNITTNGVLTLTGGTLSKALTAGTGSLIVADNARVDINSEVMALTNNGTINAMSDKFTDTVTNNGNLNLIGTTLAADIIGDNGTIRIDEGILTVASAAGKKIKQDTITISAGAGTGLSAEDAGLIGESAKIVAGGTLTLKGGTLASSKVSGYGTMKVAGDVTANNTVEVAKLEVNADNTLTIDADNLKSSSITNDGTISLGDGTLTATIGTGNVNVKSGSTVVASLAQLGTTLTNNGKLNMTGDLTKDIKGDGETVLASDKVKVDGSKEIAGTLNMNGKTINMQEDPAQYNDLKVGKLAGEGNLNIDADLTNQKSDKITVANDSTGATLNLNNIKVTGTQSNGTHNDHLTYAEGAGINSVDMKINGKAKGDADAKLVVGDGSKQYTFTEGSSKGKLDMVVEENHATLSDYVEGTDIAAPIEIFQVSADNDLTGRIETAGSRTDKKINVVNGSAIKGNGNSGILVANGYKLSLDGKDAGSAANGKMSGFDIALSVDADGELNIKDMTFENNRIDVEGPGNINLSGNNKFNSGIEADGIVTVADGLSDFVNDAKLNVSSSVTVNNGAELAMAKADNLTVGTLTNNGKLTLKGGKLSQDVSGAGTLNIEDDIELASGKTVDQKETTIAGGKTLTNNGTLTTATTIESGSAIKGNGTLNIAYDDTLNKGTIEQGKINVAEGKALINEGTLSAADGIDNSGTVKLSGGTNKADIDGSGQIEVAGSETVNEGNLRQDITINSGKLTTNADKIQGNVTNNGMVKLTGGTLAKDITDGTTEIGGDVLANAKLGTTNILTNGKLTANADNLTAGVDIADDSNLDLIGGTLTQDITGDGVTNIKGEVTTEKDINGKVTVASNGSLDIGSKEITLGSAQVDGTIKMKIDDLSADSDAYTGGKLKVTNHLELNEASSKLQLTIDAGKLDKETKTGELQLIEAGTSDGEFAQTIANNRYTITSAGNGKYTVEYTQDARETVAEAGGSANNANAAEAWDNVSGLSGAAEEVRQALNDLSQNDAQGYLKALKAVAPTDSSKNLRVVKEVNNLIGNEIARRQEMQGRSSGDAMETTGGWMEVLGNYAKQDSTSDTTGFTGKTAGFALGLDGKVNEETTVGLGYAFARTTVDADSGDTDVDGHTLFVYGKYQPSQAYVRGVASYGFADYTEKFNVAGVSAKADYDTSNIGLQAFAGYDMDNGFTPEAGFRYIRQMQDGYTDSLGQHVETDDVNLLTAVASVKYTKDYAVDNAVITPKARLGLTYDVVSDNNTADVNIGNVSYRIEGERLERLGAEAGLGLEATVDNWTLSLGYDLGLRKDYQSHTGMLKLKYEF